MPTTTLVIQDQVNIKFKELDAFTRRKISESLKFMVPYARHMPSFKLGRWDGKVSFATVGGGTFFNLLDRVLPIVIDAGYEVEIEDLRKPYEFSFPTVTEDFVADRTWPVGHPLAGEPIMLREHQVRAINTYLANLQSIQSISTSAGKTIITGCLSMLMEPYGRTICIVPNKSLVEQTEEDYRNLGLDVGVFYGDRKEWGHKHTICTWQSLAVFSKKSKRQEIDITLDEFLEGVQCVMVDETHSAQAQELKDLLTGPMAHIPVRWGLTGTVPKEDHQFISILVSLGPVVGEIRADELQKKGILSNCHVDVIQTIDNHVEFRDYHEAYKFLTTDTDRLQWLADFCKALPEGNKLILVDRIETGELIADALDCVFISGKVKTKARKQEYKSISDDTEIDMVATYGVAAVGINIPALHNLVLVEAGKSFVRVIQSIGRGLRTTKVKDFVNIYDVCSTNKWSAKHLTERKKFYKDAGYPFEITKVPYR